MSFGGEGEELKTVPEDPFENTAHVRSVMEIPAEDPFSIQGRNLNSGVGTLATHSGTNVTNNNHARPNQQVVDIF